MIASWHVQCSFEIRGHYNDIGAYFMQRGDDFGAIPWLEKALQATRYECYFYAHFNLGQIYEAT